MTGYQSKKNLRHEDDVTLSHLIDLRKLETENEMLRQTLLDVMERLALKHSKKHLQFEDIYVMIRAALREGK